MKSLPQERFYNIFKQLITLSWPIVLAFMMQVGYNVVDIFWVGRLGAMAIAAVALAGNVFFIILAVGQIIGSGTVALVAQSFGAQLGDRANSIIRQSLQLASIIALLVGISGFVFSRDIMKLLGGSGTVLVLSTEYLRIAFIGYFFQVISFSINYAFRGAGDMKTPMKIMLVATLTNVVLDPLLILGIGFFPRLEVQGAAIATAIAKCISFLFGMFILMRGKSGIKLERFKILRLESAVIKTILSVGIPVGFSYLLMGFTVMAAFRIVASFSEFALASLGIGMRVLQLASLLTVSIGISTTTMVGQSLGAHDDKRAVQIGSVATIFSATIMIILTTIFATNARFLISLFTQHTEVIQNGVDFMRIASFYLIFGAVTVSMTGVLRGAGYTLPPMFAGFIKLVTLMITANFFATNLGMGLKGVWWTLLLVYGVEAVIVSVWYFRGKWRTRGLTLLDNLRPENRK